MRHPTASILAASLLLASEVLAGPPHLVRHQHRRDLVIDTVTDDVIETIWSTVFVTIGEDGQTEGLPSATTTSVAPVQITAAAAQASALTSSATSVTSISSSAAVVLQVAASHATTSAAVVPTTLATVTKSPSSSTTSTTSASAATSSSTGKRGLAYNDASLLTNFAGSSEITWAYNWASSSDGLDLSGIEYVPLLWGSASEFTSVWSERATAAIASGSTYLMSFNEPDLSTQANIDYTTAASLYLEYMEPFAGQAKLLAPAVTNGASPMGLTYLENFISACSSCTIDHINIHWYDSASNIDYFKNYIAEAYTAGGNRPIWISEFGASGTDDEQNTFLETVLPWLDEQDYVERYAYFMASDGVLLSSGTTLSTLGNTFKSYTG